MTIRCKLEIAGRARTVTPDALADTGEDRALARRGVVNQVADWLEQVSGPAASSEEDRP